MDGKVNSASDFNENLVKKLRFEKTDENLKKVGVMQQRGTSMPLEPGGKVGYIKHELGKEYEIGDIIIYEYEDGIYVYHQVIGYKDTDSGRVYETKGINNQDPDSRGVYEHQIIGQVAKFSKLQLAYLIQMAELGKIQYIEAFGLSKNYDLVLKFEKLLNEISDTLTITGSQLLDKLYIENDYLSRVNEEFKTGSSDINEQTLKLLYTIHNLDENNPNFDPADIKKLKQEKISLLINYITHKIFSGYPSMLAQELLSKIFIQKSIVPSSFTELFIMVETINLIDLCYKRNDARIELNSKFGTTFDSPAFNTFIQNIWGKHYDHLRNLHIANSLQGLSNIIWSIPNTKTDIVLRYPSITFNPGTLNIELLLGNSRYGADHLYRGHKKDFVGLSKNLNTAEKINQFIRERIESQKGVVMNSRGRVVYAFRLAGDSRIFFLAVVVGKTILGKIITAFPILPNTRNYNNYRTYFMAKPNLIQNNIFIL